MGEHLVITIARQYGSCGREIGIRVAELLGINFYDKELITMASQKTGISADVINNIDEKATNSLLYTLALSSSSHGNASAGFNMPVNDKLFVAQSEIIRELANENDCVIIGRCGDYVLRSHKRLVSIFIYADLEEVGYFGQNCNVRIAFTTFPVADTLKCYTQKVSKRFLGQFFFTS